jgi:hypothetical protein
MLFCFLFWCKNASKVFYIILDYHAIVLLMSGICFCWYVGLSFCAVCSSYLPYVFSINLTHFWLQGFIVSDVWLTKQGKNLSSDADVSTLQGTYPCHKMPVILSHEFSGVVTSVGCDVTHLRQGDGVAVDPNRYMNGTAASTCDISDNGRQEICSMKFCYEASYQFCFVFVLHCLFLLVTQSKYCAFPPCIYTYKLPQLHNTCQVMIKNHDISSHIIITVALC